MLRGTPKCVAVVSGLVGLVGLVTVQPEAKGDVACGGVWLVAAATASGGLAQVVHVKPGGSGSRDGTSWSNAAASPALAIALMPSGGEMWVAEGTYVGSMTLPTSAVSIYGGFGGFETNRAERNPAARVTTLDGEQARRLIVAVGSTGAVIDGFTLRRGGGGAMTEGGAVRIERGQVTIRDCVIRDSFARGNVNGQGHGGGVAALNGATVVFERVHFLSNYGGTAWQTGFRTGGSGGAMYAVNSTIRLSDCVVTGSSSGAPEVVSCNGGTALGGGPGANGGGLYLSGGSLSIDRCVFLDNAASSGTSGGSCSMRLSTSSAFAGGAGGAIYTLSTTVSVRNSIFAGNRAGRGGSAAWSNPPQPRPGASSGSGGAICVINGSINILNCTITNNEVFAGGFGAGGGGQGSPGSGGGVYAFNPTIRNSILTANRGLQSTLQNQLALDGTVRYSCVDGITVAPASGNFSSFVGFSTAGGFEPRRGSPTIDAGSTEGVDVGTLDSRGRPRDIDISGVANRGAGASTSVDIGAVELSYCIADVAPNAPTVGDGSVTIEDLLAYLSAFDAGVIAADVDDGTGRGLTDGGVDIGDLTYFLSRFAIGC